MIVKIYDLRHVEATSNCPICNFESGHDAGNLRMSELKPKMTFWCEEHGEWSEPIDWGAELNKLIEKN